MQCFRRSDGNGSRSHNLLGDCCMTMRTLAVVAFVTHCNLFSKGHIKTIIINDETWLNASNFTCVENKLHNVPNEVWQGSVSDSTDNCAAHSDAPSSPPEGSCLQQCPWQIDRSKRNNRTAGGNTRQGLTVARSYCLYVSRKNYMENRGRWRAGGQPMSTRKVLQEVLLELGSCNTAQGPVKWRHVFDSLVWQNHVRWFAAFWSWKSTNYQIIPPGRWIFLP